MDDDDVGEWDDLDWDDALRHRLLTPLPVPTRRWTDDEWAAICRWSEGVDRKSRWKGVVTTGRRLRLYPRTLKQGAFEAEFARGDDRWTITGLVLYRHPYMAVRRDHIAAFAESLIESIVRGDEDLPMGEWLTQREAFLKRKQRKELVDDFGLPIVFDDASVQRSLLARVADQASNVHAHSTPTGDTMSACLYCQYKIPLLDSPIGPAGSPVGLCRNCNSLSCGWHGARAEDPVFLCIVCDGTKLFASVGWEAFRKEGGLKRLKLPPVRRAAPGVRDGPAIGASDDEAARELARALAALFSTADGYPSPFLVASLQQWLDERPSYRKFMGPLTQSSDWAVREIDRYLAASARAGLSDPDAMAPGIAQRGPGHYGFGAIRSLWERLDTDRRRLLAAAALLMVTLEIPEYLMAPPVADIAIVIGGMLDRDRDQIGRLRSQITAPQ